MDMMNRRSFFSHRQPSQQRSRTQSSRPPDRQLSSAVWFLRATPPLGMGLGMAWESL